MNTQPSPPARRITWYVEHAAWRVEYVAGRWSLSRYSPGSETWERVGSYPTRKAAVRRRLRRGEPVLGAAST
jgi:hypothetical protein